MGTAILMIVINAILVTPVAIYLRAMYDVWGTGEKSMGLTLIAIAGVVIINAIVYFRVSNARG